MSMGQELENRLVTDEVRDSPQTGLQVVRDADRQQVPSARGRALLQLAEEHLERHAPMEGLTQAIVNDIVPEFGDAAVLDVVDARYSRTRAATAVSDDARGLAPRLAEPAADAVTRDAILQVMESELAYTGTVWVSPRADELPPEGPEHDGATRWHIHAIPLFVRARMVGVLAVVSARRNGADAVRVLGEYARRVAPALELARLEEQELRASRPQRLLRGLRLLEDIGTIVSAGGEEAAVIRKVAERMVQDAADFCAIELHDGTGAVRHDVVRYAGGLSRLAPDRLRKLKGDIPERSGEDDTGGSSITVPISSPRGIEGTITLVSVRREVEYGPDETALVNDIAGRLAGVVDRTRLQRNAQLALLAKSEFLSVMSHELRTPLTAILGYTALLREGFAGKLTAMQARHLAGIESSGVHMVSMIDDILSFVGMEAGWDTVSASVVVVADVVDEVLLPARSVAVRKGLGVSAEFGEVPKRLRMDAAKVRRLLGNLLSNAVKFTDSGTVTLRVDYKPELLVLSVSDSGSGVRPTLRGQIFEPFWQAEAATTRRVGGIGLGLSVARRIATLLGGSLDVEDSSTGGTGTVFTARIPVEEVGSGLADRAS